MKQFFRSSLFKQLCGAAIGATLAYGLYVVYQQAVPRLNAYVDVFWSDTDTGARFATKEPDEFDRQLERQASRNNEIRERFAAPADSSTLNVKSNAFDDIAERAKQFEAQLTDQEVEDLTVEEETEPEQNLYDLEPPAQQPDANEQWQEEWEQMERETVDTNEDLPDSGVGISMIAVAALGGTSVLRRKRRKA